MATKELPRLEVESRERLGTRYSSRLRESGRLPAVIYGHGKGSQHVSVDSKAIVELLHNNVHVLEVPLPEGSEHCLIKDIQWDHLGTTIIHVDLARVDLAEMVEVEVQVEYFGDPVGIKEPGAILEHPFDTIEVECRVDQIPEVIRIDVSGLKVDDIITVADLALEEGVRCTMNPETVLATVHILAEEEVEEVAPEADAAEPEVIGRPKAEDGDAASDAKKPDAKK